MSRPAPRPRLGRYAAEIERSRRAGFAEHLVKPVDIVQFRAAIDRALRPAGPVPPEPEPAPSGA